MAVLVTDLVNETALWANDRNFSRIRREDWLLAYNQVQTEVATECRVLEEDADFDIIANEQRYTYPDDSEDNQVINNFNALSTLDQGDLLAFINSL